MPKPAKEKKRERRQAFGKPNLEFSNTSKRQSFVISIFMLLSFPQTSQGMKKEKTKLVGT